ncbi:MAG: molybdopterin-dependent oxidoreductase [Verrucomicrobiales bacterium]|nr:molybdopterin-dependent oxidoreductase [Verrucomicrobiales bacterium]
MKTAHINSRPVEIRPGETILAAAQRIGIDLPAPCRTPGPEPLESCRLCVVQVNGQPFPVAACGTMLEAGMDVQTHHVAVERWRTSLLRIVAESAARTDHAPSRVRDGVWSELLSHYGVTPPAPQRNDLSKPERDTSHSWLRFDPAACISCGACLTTCETVAHQHVWEIAGRGPRRRIQPVGGRPLALTPCTACGACIDPCPTGALVERHGHHPAEEPRRSVESVCGLCPVGCGLRIESADGEVRRVSGLVHSPTNPGGLLCKRGKFAHVAHQNWDRITQPMLRRGAGFCKVSWDEALDFIAKRLSALVHAHGPAAFGAIAGAGLSTESAYLLQKFTRSVIGSPHIDSVAHTDPALDPVCRAAFPGTASFADLDRATCIVVLGADLDESHPVLAARVRQAVADGAALIVVHPRRIALSKSADCHHSDLTPPPPDDSSDDPLCRLLLTHRSGTVCLVGSDIATPEHLSGWMSRLNGLGTSALPGAGLIFLGGVGNHQGLLLSGALADSLPGHVPVSDSQARARIEDLWGRCLPVESGLPLTGMLVGARDGRLRGLWLAGYEPDRVTADATLAGLDLLVVHDLIYQNASRHAHVLLPAASLHEQTGTAINAERRVQLLRAAVPPPDEARPDWAVLTVLARRLGVEWPYLDPAEIFAELALLAPDRLAGITHRRLDEQPEGIQWPCPGGNA